MVSPGVWGAGLVALDSSLKIKQICVNMNLGYESLPRTTATSLLVPKRLSPKSQPWFHLQLEPRFLHPQQLCATQPGSRAFLQATVGLPGESE